MNNVLNSNKDIYKLYLKLSSLEKGLINEKLDKKSYLNPIFHFSNSDKYPMLIVIDGVPKPLINATSDRMLLIHGYYGEEKSKNLRRSGGGLGMIALYGGLLYIINHNPELILGYSPIMLITVPVLIIALPDYSWWCVKKLLKPIGDFFGGLWQAFCNSRKMSKISKQHKQIENKHFSIQRSALKHLLTDIEKDDKEKDKKKINGLKHFSLIDKTIIKSYSRLASFL